MLLSEQSGNKEVKVDNIEDPEMAKYMEENHPRFYQLVGTYGSPLDMVNLKKEGKNISQTSAKIEMINKQEGMENSKTFKKKLLLNMTVTDLKAMCSKLFKLNVLEQYLCYQGPEDTQEYPLDEDFRQISFFSMADEGKLFVRNMSQKVD